MPQESEARRAGGAAGLLELSCGEADNQDLKPNHAALQARNRTRRQRLVGHLPVWPAVERYAALPADFIKTNGGDRFATALRVLAGEEP
jgi:hypothetical protein